MILHPVGFWANLDRAETIFIFGTSSIPGTGTDTDTSPNPAAVTWEFNNDGTSWYTLDGVRTQFSDGSQWNNAQDSPVEDWWLMYDDEQIASGSGIDSGSSSTAGVWHKVSGSGSANVFFQWRQESVGTNESTVRVRVARDSLGTVIEETGYCRAVVTVNA